MRGALNCAYDRFIGLILLPLVGNAAEHVTSVWMATKNKMELVIVGTRVDFADNQGVSVGSSIQIAAGMIPLLVIIAWPLNKELTLFFANFETIVLFVSVMLVNLLLQDGRSNYMEGVMRECAAMDQLTRSALTVWCDRFELCRVVKQKSYDVVDTREQSPRRSSK